MPFAIAEKPRFPRRIFPLTAMCLLDSFSAFYACDSIHKHPCSMVMSTRVFAIVPPLSRYPQHSALLRDLITLSAYLCCSGSSASLLYQTGAANTNSSAWQPRMPPTRRASPVCEALQYIDKKLRYWSAAKHVKHACFQTVRSSSHKGTSAPSQNCSPVAWQRPLD